MARAPHSIILCSFGISDDGLRRRSAQNPGALLIRLGRITIARGGRIVKLPRGPARVLVALLCADGRPISIPDLVQFLYATRLDGGPEYADVLVRAWVSDASLVAPAINVAIETRPGLGFAARILYPPEAG